MSVESIVIMSDSMGAVLSAGSPRLISINGISGGAQARVRVFEKSTRTDRTDDLTISYAVSHSRNFTTYTGNVSLDGRDAAQFVLRYLVQDNRLTITCEFKTRGVMSTRSFR